MQDISHGRERAMSRSRTGSGSQIVRSVGAGLLLTAACWFSGTAQATMPADCTHLSGEQDVDRVVGADQDFQACFSLSGHNSERQVTVYTFSGLQYGHEVTAYGFREDTDEVEQLAASSTAESDVTEVTFAQVKAGSFFTIDLPDNAGTDFHVDLGHIPMDDEVRVYIEIRPQD